MDPDATLAEIRRLVAEFHALEATLTETETVDALDSVAARIIELTEALDAWLSLGGFPPETWRQAR